MSKVKKESCSDSNVTSSLKRTIVNAPSNSKTDDHDRYNRTSHSRSTDSSPERKQTKYGKPVARGSEMGIVFDKKELKKISITIKNKLAPVKAPAVHITNPETITPVRRRDEGMRPIFEKNETKEKSSSPEEHKSSSSNKHLELNRRKYRSRSREESPDDRRRRSRRDHSGSHKHRRAHTPSSRRSSSSSSSSSDERRRKKNYYLSRAEKEREERHRREYLREKEMQYRERKLQDKHRRYPDEKPFTHSNGNELQNRLKERTKKNYVQTNEEESDSEVTPQDVVNPKYPVRIPPPFLMRPPPMRPFVPGLPGYPLPYPPHMRFFPHPPVPMRPGLRPPRPPRGYY